MVGVIELINRKKPSLDMLVAQGRNSRGLRQPSRSRRACSGIFEDLEAAELW